MTDDREAEEARNREYIYALQLQEKQKEREYKEIEEAKSAYLYDKEREKQEIEEEQREYQERINKQQKIEATQRELTYNQEKRKKTNSSKGSINKENTESALIEVFEMYPLFNGNRYFLSSFAMLFILCIDIFSCVWIFHSIVGIPESLDINDNSSLYYGIGYILIGVIVFNAIILWIASFKIFELKIMKILISLFGIIISYFVFDFSYSYSFIIGIVVLYLSIAYIEIIQMYLMIQMAVILLPFGVIEVITIIVIFIWFSMYLFKGILYLLA